MDRTISACDAELFDKDDLEFRTITTILHALGSREKITLENFDVSRKQRPHLKILSALSSLLVRDHEILAILPKRSAAGMTVFVGSEEDALLDDSLSSCSTLHNFTARKPGYRDPIGTVKLLDTPVVEVGLDVFGFIQRNWKQSFECHVQAFANLLNEYLNNPDDSKRIAIDRFSIFQSAPKVCRRLKHSPLLTALPLIDPSILESGFSGTVQPSSTDHFRIDLILMINENGTTLHPELDEYLCTPNSTLHLSDFHRFFVWFLKIVSSEIQVLGKLRRRPSPLQALPEIQIDLAHTNLESMGYFAWQSKFFAAYIQALFIGGIPKIAGNIIPVVGTTREPPNERDPEQYTEEENQDERAGSEEENQLDISTEFETGEDQGSTTEPQSAVHACVLELRLITSNIEHLITLFRRSPKTHFRLQMIQYSRSDLRLKPWRDLIREMFPDQKTQEETIQSLVDEPNWKFDIFRSKNPVEFKGQAHCEAVLGCLYSLTQRREDVSWTGIPDSLLNTISTCYILLVPSKRCCPVCATIISLLSTEGFNAGGQYLHARSKHSIIFPCALPIGLPRSIRESLLQLYRRKLYDSLVNMLPLKQRLSNRSGQSASLSDNGSENEEAAAEEKMKSSARHLYASGWTYLDPEARRVRWDRGRLRLTLEQRLLWWGEIPEEMKTELTPPG